MRKLGLGTLVLVLVACDPALGQSGRRPARRDPSRPSTAAVTDATSKEELRSKVVAAAESAKKAMEKDGVPPEVSAWIGLYINGHRLRDTPLLSPNDYELAIKTLKRQDVKRWLEAEDKYLGASPVAAQKPKSQGDAKARQANELESIQKIYSKLTAPLHIADVVSRLGSAGEELADNNDGEDTYKTMRWSSPSGRYAVIAIFKNNYFNSKRLVK